MPTLPLALDASGAKRGADQWQKQINRVDRGASQADKSMRRTGSAFGFVGKAATAALGPLAAFFAIYKVIGTIGSGIRLAGELEQTTVAFTTMLGSAEAAKQTLQDIAEFAASTPFQLEGLQKAARTLIAFKVDQKDLIPVMRQLGDVAAGTNQPLEDIAFIYGKARASGRLFQDDINQLTERGIPIISELAKQFGVTDDKVRELVSSGKVGFNNLEEAIRSLTSEGGSFFNLTEKQSKTFLGVLSTFKDNIIGVLRGIGQVFTEELDLTGFLNDMIMGVQAAGPAIVEGIRWAFQTTRNIISTVVDFIAPVWDAMWGVLVSTAQTAWEMIKEVFTTLSGLVTSVLEAMGVEFGGAGEWLHFFRALFIEVLLRVEFAVQNWRDILTLHLLNVGTALSSFLDKATHVFGVAIPEVLKFAFNNWREIFQDIGNITITVFSNIVKAVRDSVGLIVDLIAGNKGLGDVGSELLKISQRSLLEGFESSLDPEAVTELLNKVTTVTVSERTKTLQSAQEHLRSVLNEKMSDFLDRRRSEIFELEGQTESRSPVNALKKIAEDKKKSDDFKINSAKSGVGADISGVETVSVSSRFTGVALQFQSQNRIMLSLLNEAARTAKNTEETAASVKKMANATGGGGRSLRVPNA